MRTNRKAFSVVHLTAYSILLAAQAILPASAFADDGKQSLSGSNFTNSLSQSDSGGGVFRYRSPLKDALSPQGPASYQPSTMGETENYSPFSSSPQQAASASSSSGPDKVIAWYKFLGPSLNLSRALEESERKHLLSIVPMPPDIRGGDHRKNDNHVVLLRANNNADYACFKTICGSLFGRSGTLMLVSSSGSLVHILNLNGREKDVLFKLSDGQVITIGPGSEMIIARSLGPHDVNSDDWIARRGFTRTMKCSQMQMAFAQFSFASVFELPELKFFRKNQSPEYIQALMATVSQIDEIRGKAGFRQAVSRAEQSPQHDHELGSAARTGVVKLVPVQKPAGANQDADRERSRKIARAREEAAHKKEAEHKKEAAQKQKNEIIAAATPATRKDHAAETSGHGLLSSFTAIKKKERKTKHDEPGAAGQEDKPLPAARAVETKGREDKASKTAEKPRSVEKRKSTTTAQAGSPTSNSQANSSAPRLLLPRSMPGSNTPPEIAKLLLEANSAEKEAAALRKKADRCVAFMDGGLMNPEQQRRMMAEAKKHLKLASEAEERSQALRRQAQIAESGKQSVQ